MSVAVAIGGVILVLGAIWRTMQVWRNSTADLDGYPPGFLRAMPALLLTMLALFGGGLLTELLSGDQETTIPAQLTAIVSTLLVLSGIVLTATTAARGRPSWIVPPHLRRERNDG